MKRAHANIPCTSYYPSVYLAMHCVGNKHTGGERAQRVQDSRGREKALEVVVMIQLWWSCAFCGHPRRWRSGVYEPWAASFASLWAWPSFIDMVAKILPKHRAAFTGKS